MSVGIVAIIPNEKNQNAGRSDKEIWLCEDGLLLRYWLFAASPAEEGIDRAAG